MVMNTPPDLVLGHKVLSQRLAGCRGSNARRGLWGLARGIFALSRDLRQGEGGSCDAKHYRQDARMHCQCC